MPSGGRWEGGGGVKILGGSHGFREGKSVVAEKVYGKDWRKLNDN